MSADKERGRILVVDDHVEMVELLAAQLGDEGYGVDVATDGKSALAQARERLPDAVIVDLRMEEVDGLDVLDAIQRIDKAVPVIIMTAFGEVESAVEAIKRGAYHYITKPFQMSEILVYVERALEEHQVRNDNRALRRLALDKSSLEQLVGVSEPMVELRQLVEKVALTDASVLIRGESGTGKELVARAIHFLSARGSKPLVPVNCTVLPEALLESELFGHTGGAFTGAGEARRGLFVEADEGTLLLDEIGDMPANLQAKLLRVLQEGEIRPVGSDKRRKVDVRIVAATHQDLEQEVERGEFREDLFFRLNVIPIDVPPLRRRTGDIPLLINHFIEQTREVHPNAVVESFSDELVEHLQGYRWPGNVRELKNVVERLIILGDHACAELGDLEDFAPSSDGGSFDVQRSGERMQSLRQMTDEYIDWVVRQCDGNKTRAAEILGIDASTIYRRKKNQSD
ncbi:MAG: sigma-54-dependent transcriptional regulator [Myxococcota bacterium]